MNLEMLRRVSAGVFVLMMGLVAALPYQSTRPMGAPSSVTPANQSPSSPASFWGAVENGREPPVSRPLAALPAQTPQRLVDNRRATPRPMLLLDPEQPAQPVPDIRPSPPMRSRLTQPSPETTLRPSEMRTPSTPQMAPRFPPPSTSSAHPPLATDMGPALRLWDEEMTPVPHRQRHFQPVPQSDLNQTSSGPAVRSRHPGLRTHTIRDGDTLGNIAKRFLNDESRAMEIFELNRTVLPSPVLLPLGVKLRIPPEASSVPPGMTPIYSPSRH